MPRQITRFGGVLQCAIQYIVTGGIDRVPGIRLSSAPVEPVAEFGGEGAIDSCHPGPRPPGALRASTIAPAILSNPHHFGGKGSIVRGACPACPTNARLWPPCRWLRG